MADLKENALVGSKVKAVLSGHEGDIELSFKFNHEGLADWLLENFGERWLGYTLLEHPAVRQKVTDWLTGDNFCRESGDVPSKIDEMRSKVIGALAERVCESVAHALKSARDLHEQYFQMRRYAESLERGIRDGSITKDTKLNAMPDLHLPVDWEREFKNRKEFAEAVREALFDELTAILKAAKK